uniref:Thrombopoietin n=1 Tax=Stegastes partitus TaxID=144197 RepID=A0A3B4ZB94_9TELE
MAARQSFPLYAPPGLLLLLIGVISTHLPEVHARPIDFWCKNDSRRKIMGMMAEKADCVGSDELPSPVQLPCVGLHLAEWTNKTLQQKRTEVLGALRVFSDGVKSVKSQVKLQCHTSWLERLEHSINNHLDDLTPSPSAVENCSPQTSLNEVLTQYRKLLAGKLEQLAKDLQDTDCREEHRTGSSQGS